MINEIKNKQLTIFFLTLLSGVIIAFYLTYRALTNPTTSNNTWFLAFQVLIGIGLCFMPFGIEKLFKMTTSRAIKDLYWLFIFCAVFLGTGLSFYSKFSNWDKFLHFSSAILLVTFGFGILSLLMPKFKHLSIGTIVLFGFFFAMTMGVVWEFYEYTFDGLLNLNMQRFATSAGKNLVGREVLKDTMGDLFTNTAGALAMALYSYVKGRKNSDWLHVFLFTPTKNKHN